MNPRNGLFGGVVIGPKGSQYRDPKTGADISEKNSWIADVIVDRSVPGNEHRANYRDVALYFQDEDNIIGTSFMPYVQNVAGLVGVNYRNEPYCIVKNRGVRWAGCSNPVTSMNRMNRRPRLSRPMPATRFGSTCFGASNEQNGMFTLEKHEWPIEPFMEGADHISVVEFSGSEGIDAFIASAGGRISMPGDYVYSNARLPYSQSGQWGYFRVLSKNDQRILPLSGASPESRKPKRVNLNKVAFDRSRSSNNTGLGAKAYGKGGEAGVGFPVFFP